MAIQDYLSATSLLPPQDQKLGIISAGEEHYYYGKTLAELPMPREGSASSEISSADSAKSGYSFFADSSPLEVKGWPVTQSEYNANVAYSCGEGAWNSQFETDCEGQLANMDYYHCHSTDQPAPRRAASKESTGMLKEWLRKNSKNPYPSKSEKIMLAIVTKMSLTQVSTWFANARRRLKKENKMTWTPKNRSNDFANNSSRKRLSEESSNGDLKEFGSAVYDETLRAEINYQNELSSSVTQTENCLNYYPLPDVSSTFGKGGQASLISQYHCQKPPTEFKTFDSHDNVLDRGQSSPEVAQAEGVQRDHFVPNFPPPVTSQCHPFNAYQRYNNSISCFSHAQHSTQNGQCMVSPDQFYDDQTCQKQILQRDYNYQQKNQYYHQHGAGYYNQQNSGRIEYNGVICNHLSDSTNTPTIANISIPSKSCQVTSNTGYFSVPFSNQQTSELTQPLTSPLGNCGNWNSSLEKNSTNLQQHCSTEINSCNILTSQPTKIQDHGHQMTNLNGLNYPNEIQNETNEVPPSTLIISSSVPACKPETVSEVSVR